MSKPEWKELSVRTNLEGIWWCRGCGCIKIKRPGERTKYLTPKRERERRMYERFVPE